MSNRPITIDTVTVTYHTTELLCGDITDIVPVKVAQRWCYAGLAHWTTGDEVKARDAAVNERKPKRKPKSEPKPKKLRKGTGNADFVATDKDADA